MAAKKKTTTRTYISKKKTNNVSNRGTGTYESASRGSNRARSAAARARSNERRTAARKPAPYGRTEDGWPRLGSKGMSGLHRSNAAKKRRSTKKGKGLSA